MLVSDKYRELPDIWSIKTDTPLPVNHGTKVELECIPGYSLSGSNVITLCLGQKLGIWDCSRMYLR